MTYYCPLYNFFNPRLDCILTVRERYYSYSWL